MLQHHRAVAELLHQAVFSLDGSIGHLSDLVTIEPIPAEPGARLDEVDDVVRVLEVDEGVSDVAIVGKVDAKVHEVVLPSTGLVHNLLQHLLVDLVWDVAKHDRSSDIESMTDALHIDDVVMSRVVLMVRSTTHTDGATALTRVRRQ